MAKIAVGYRDVGLGRVAKLKSGGPDMTIIGFEKGEPRVDADAPAGATYAEQAPLARCHWFTDVGQPHSGLFPIEALDVKGDDREARRDAPVLGGRSEHDPL